MKTKLFFFIFFACFFVGVLGYSSDTGPSPGTPNNNLHTECVPCQAEDTQRYGAGNHELLYAVAISRAWKDSPDFKWRATYSGHYRNSTFCSENNLGMGT